MDDRPSAALDSLIAVDARRSLRPDEVARAAQRRAGDRAPASCAKGARPARRARHRRFRFRLSRLAGRRARSAIPQVGGPVRRQRHPFRARASTRSWRRPRSGARSRRSCAAKAASTACSALWYGKGPGVDRSGDVFRHANLAGTSRHGGVLALMGDDPTAESSTTAHQSEFAFVDAMMPVLSPAGVQEILDYGALGWALSRYAGVWVGLKCLKDTIEFDGGGRRFARPRRSGRAERFSDAAGRPRTSAAYDGVLAQEARLHEDKRAAVVAWLAANRLDRIVASGGARPRSASRRSASPISTCARRSTISASTKRAATRSACASTSSPAPGRSNRRVCKAFAAGLSLIVVVEEKRALIEAQTARGALRGRASARGRRQARRSGAMAVSRQGRARSRTTSRSRSANGC